MTTRQRRYYIRLGNERGRGFYVSTYCGGSVTATGLRRKALFWHSPDLVRRLRRAIRKVDGLDTRTVSTPTPKRSKGSFCFEVK